jgi:hypothetical protein
MMGLVSAAFGGMALFAIIAAGFVMMFEPAKGREMLKNIVISILLFTIGSMMLQIFFTRHR